MTLPLPPPAPVVGSTPATAPQPPIVGDDALVLGIETSCDETAAAVVAGGGRRVLSSVVSSQIDLHARYGGVVPEIAGRAHVELMLPVIAEATVTAGAADDDIAAVAATCGPGLVGALLVGVSGGQGPGVGLVGALCGRQPPRSPPPRAPSSMSPTSSCRWW